jgi:hypothetical protein
MEAGVMTILSPEEILSVVSSLPKPAGFCFAPEYAVIARPGF